jgi:hypothetical protein
MWKLVKGGSQQSIVRPIKASPEYTYNQKVTNVQAICSERSGVRRTTL